MTSEDRFRQLETRLQELEEIEGVRKTQARYCKVVDDADLEGVKGVFARECQVVINPWGEWKSREEVIGFYRSYFENVKTPRHYITNQDIRIQGDEAHAISYFQATVESKGDLLFGEGNYEDTLVKEGGAWKFKKKVISILHLSPLVKEWATKEKIVKLAPS